MFDRAMQTPPSSSGDPAAREHDGFSAEQAFAALDLAGVGLWALERATGQLRLSAGAAGLLKADSRRVELDALTARMAVEDRASLAALFGDSNPAPSTVEAVMRSEDTAPPRRLAFQRSQSDREIFGVVVDVTEQHAGDARRRELIQELQHRIKNMLAVVRSLANRTRSNSRSLEEFSAHFDGRLAALAHVQTALARSPAGAVDLENLVREELLKSAGEVEDAVTIKGPDIGLKGRTAELMALALHELAANAVKFGSLSSQGRRLSVSWRVEPSEMGRRLRLDWFEADIGPVAPSGAGFGFELLRQGLPYELGAEVDIRFEGGDFRCVIQAPLADEAVG